MYESYWQLSERPFEHTLDSRFYYPAESHQGAFLKLRYAIENRRSAALVAGPAGIGKTLLVQTLTRQLPESFSPIIQLVFPQMPADQLVNYLADELAGEKSAVPATIEQSLRRLEHHLLENHRAGKHAIVIVDEAHLLRESSALETLRLLMNYEADSQPLFTLVLISQPSLLPTLHRSPELEERLGAKCLLKKFTVEETMSYVHHRLATAGATQPIFTTEALEKLHDLSQGLPRRINRLADLALVVGYADETQEINESQIGAVAEELLMVEA